MRILLAAIPLATLVTPTLAQTRVALRIENLAPGGGTFQTPFWVGFHDGNFDIYDSGVAASTPLGNDSLERIAEDGDTSTMMSTFAASGVGQDATVFGPNGPIAPGDVAFGNFLMPAPSDVFFGYASMVIPSNDAFLAGGNPAAHPVFDNAGNFVFETFFLGGADVLDAGTEVNDELPVNTAFFGQMAPDTGSVENGVVMPHVGFLPVGSGGILDSPMFANGDFSAAGYPAARVSMRVAPAITDDRNFRAAPRGSEEVPAVQTPARGRSQYLLRDGGEVLEIAMQFRNLRNVVAGHLHLAPAGANGPVVASLLEPMAPGGGLFNQIVTVELRTGDLVGPLAGMPLDALIPEIEAGNVYINVHTDDGLPGDNTGPGDFASGEVRGQLERF